MQRAHFAGLGAEGADHSLRNPMTRPLPPPPEPAIVTTACYASLDWFPLKHYSSGFPQRARGGEGVTSGQLLTTAGKPAIEEIDGRETTSASPGTQ